MSSHLGKNHKLPFLDPSQYNWRHSPALWAEMSGLKVDAIPFSFEGHRYLFPLFIDVSPKIVWMKSAQMGATIWMLLRAFHQALYPKVWGFNTPIKVGFYFPEGPGLNLLVKGRVEPIMRNCPELAPYAKEKSRSWKPIGDSALYFLYMGGTSSKDSTPLMSIFFDEVRLMNINAVEQAKERVSHSEIEYIHKVSTAGFPESDIHHFFLNSDQKWFTTICEGCGYEQILCLDFPDCIAEHTHGPRRGQSYYICKNCRGEIKDPQRGRYVPHGDPKHEISGYQVSQLISTRKKPSDILQTFRTMTNKKEFYNGKLGIPFVDEENRPVTIDMLNKNVDPLLEWGPGSIVSNTFMGVDQMSGENYVTIISNSVLGGLKRLIWLEIINDRDPFKRTAELMDEFNIKVCVCDAEPNSNDALRFAKHFGKRVFLAKYVESDDLVRWKDSWQPKKEHRKADPSTYHQYRVFLDKFQSIERTLMQIKSRQIIWPDPNGRIQAVFPFQGGKREAMPILRTHAYPMYASAIKEKLARSVEESDYTWRWNFIGLDPHALVSLDYALRASERRVSSNPILSSY